MTVTNDVHAYGTVYNDDVLTIIRCSFVLVLCLQVSYNMLLTAQVMLLVPRGAERVGPCAFNALAFAGESMAHVNLGLCWKVLSSAFSTEEYKKKVGFTGTPNSTLVMPNSCWMNAARPLLTATAIQEVWSWHLPKAHGCVESTCHEYITNEHCLCPCFPCFPSIPFIPALCSPGTALVRSDEELAFVKDTGPTHVLAQAGVPWPV